MQVQRLFGTPGETEENVIFLTLMDQEFKVELRYIKY